MIVAEQIGFCFGVKRAINLAKKVLSERGEVCILGDLVHNRRVSRELEQMGLRKVSNLSECSSGIMLVRAHGLPAAEIEGARAAGLEVIDATCPTVRQAQRAARRLEGTWLPGGDCRRRRSLGGARHPWQSPRSVGSSGPRFGRGGWQAHAERRFRRPVGVVFQTTHSFERCHALVGELMLVIPELQIINTLFRPVRNRQLDAIRLATEVEVMLVVGSFKSANSIELTHLLRAHNPNTIQVEKRTSWSWPGSPGVKSVGIASGLSTPEDVVDAVRARLEAAFPEPDSSPAL